MASLIRNFEPVESAGFTESSAVVTGERQPHVASNLPEAGPVEIRAGAAPTNLTVDSTLDAPVPFSPSTDVALAHASPEPQPRADVIARVRVLIAGGYYDRPGFIDLLADHIEAGLNRSRK